MELWNEAIVDKSWRMLQYLRRKYDFVLIGGWAIYLYTKSLKSKDIDFVTSISELKNIGLEYTLHKNERLRKYEIKMGEIDVDIYVPYWSKLAVPPEDIIKNAVSIENFKVVSPEHLLILKIDAEISRKNSIKGFKDRVDIIALLLSGYVNKDKLFHILRNLRMEYQIDELRRIIQMAYDEFLYLSIRNPREIKKIKKELENTYI